MTTKQWDFAEERKNIINFVEENKQLNSIDIVDVILTSAWVYGDKKHKKEIEELKKEREKWKIKYKGLMEISDAQFKNM